MRVLITGGAGFIGSNIAKYMLQKGYKVRIIDNLSTGDIQNIAGLPIEFLHADICESVKVEEACKGVSIVFHLAASVGRQLSLDYPLRDSSTNLLGTINVLEGMRKQGVGKIVYSSSAAIFGELCTPAISEDHPQQPDSPYGVSKLAAEKMILCYAGIYGIRCVCLRYFNVYGIHQRYNPYGNVIPIFAKSILKAEPITIFGDGLQTRDFLCVDDVVRANALAAEENIDCNQFNLGSGGCITINELASQMMDICGRKVDIFYAPKRPADVMHCLADCEKAKRILRFSARVSLEKGLQRYIEWYRLNCLD